MTVRVTKLSARNHNWNFPPLRLVVSKRPVVDEAVNLSLSFPSLSVALVRRASGRSARLPAPCDVCQKSIDEYPFIAKHSNNGRHRMYHIDCALRIGLVAPVPRKV